MPGPMQRNVIDNFETLVHQLIAEAARYVAEGPGEDGTEEAAQANIRRLRTLSSALNAALQSIQMRTPLPGSPSR